ncbi:N-acetyltransferase [candidate division KSB1 bacterium]|nr:N-acetyltransferase [candidate division KSB1 bacterium]
MDVIIRDAFPTDAIAICDIYNHYVLNTIITFEESPISLIEMVDRINEVQEKFPWIVAQHNDDVIGFAYASSWKSRCAYKYSVESTVYLEYDRTGKGLGTALYSKLLEQIKLLNLHAVIGGIALPNPGSVALHEKFGFKNVAQFEQVGYKFNTWIDVGYWELILDDISE